MIYLDSNIFIYAVNDSGEKGNNARKILNSVADGSNQGLTSTITWDEIVFVFLKKKGREMAGIQGKKFLEFPSLYLISADESIIQKAQEIIEKYGLKPRDAIHVASAIINSCDVIISDDSDFDKVKEIKRRGL